MLEAYLSTFGVKKVSLGGPGCYTPLHAATAPECWEEAKYYLSKSEEAAAKHPALKVEET